MARTGHGLKIEKIGPTFLHVLMLCLQKLKKNYIMASTRWWNLFDLLYNITGVFRFSKRGSLLVSVMTSAQNWAKRATLVVLNFAILARLNLAGFYFRDFTRQSLWKKALDFAIKAFSTWFYFFKRLNFLKQLIELKELP